MIIPFCRNWPRSAVLPALVLIVITSQVRAVKTPEGQGGGREAFNGTAAPPADAGSQAPVRLTLEEAIKMALHNNLDIRMAGYQPPIAATKVDAELSVFDPVFSSTTGYSSSHSPVFTVFAGKQPHTRTWKYSSSLQANTLSGGVLALSIQSSKTTTNDPFVSSVSPYYQTSASLQLSQPLLKGAGTDIARTNIIIAQNNLRMSTLDFQDKVMDLVLNVETAYWNLAYARANIEPKKKSLKAALELLKNNKIKYDAQALPRVEVTRARARAAEREQDLVTAEAVLRNAEDTLRGLLGPDALSLLSTAPIIAVSPATVHAEQLELASSVNYALAMRPDVRQQMITLESRDILLARARNQLLPEVDIQATYAINGLGATSHDDVEDLTTFNNTAFSAAISLQIPLGNRRARSGYTSARYQRLQDITALALLQQKVSLSVKNAIRSVATSLKQIDTARLRVEAATQQLSDERDRYDVGLSISLDVLDAQEALQKAESAKIASVYAFNQAMANYYRQTGQILQRYNITVLSPAIIRKGNETCLP